MPYLMLVLRYWKAIAGAVVLVIGLFGLNRYETRAFERGRQDGIRLMQKELTAMRAKLTEAEHKAHEQAEEYAKQMALASAQYQINKAEREETEKVRYVEVQKIVEKPVYINHCLDERGLHELNRAVKDK